MLRPSCLILAPALLLAAPPAPGEGAKEALNRCLTKSTFQALEADGQVTVQAPDRTYRFQVLESGFNVNVENGDARLRIASTSPYFRQSFLCVDEASARRAVQLLRDYRKAVIQRSGGRTAHLQRPLDAGDVQLGFRTVAEAVDFINDRFSLSVVVGLDTHGFLSIAGADGVYRVDLRKAEFSLNDRGERAKVRVYGDWAIDYAPDGRGGRAMARESFSTDSTRETLQVVKALYLLKAHFTGMDRAAVATLGNVDPLRKPDTKTLQGAMDALNAKLTVSRIVRVEPSGRVLLNAAEHLYVFDLGSVNLDRVKPASTLKGWVQGKVGSQPEEGVVLRGDIRRYADPSSFERVEELAISCETYFDSQDALALLKELQERLRRK